MLFQRSAQDRLQNQDRSMMKKTDKEMLVAIYNEIVGEPEFNRKGIRKQTDENTEDIKKLQDGNFKRNVIVTTAVSAATAVTTWVGKSSIAKAFATLMGAGTADKMIK